MTEGTRVPGAGPVPEPTHLEEPRGRPGCSLWLRWELATVVSSLLGQALFFLLALVSHEPTWYEDPYWLAAWVLAGSLLGGAQWLVLRRCILKAGWWILATTAGWALGGIGSAVALDGASGIGAALAEKAVLGAVMGVGQWCVLRRSAYRAGWWVPASTAAWSGGWAATAAAFLAVEFLETSGLVGPAGRDLPWVLAAWGIPLGAVSGALSGLALLWILGRPKHTQHLDLV